MKKMIALFLALAAILSCTACGQKEEAPTVEPDVTEMRAICELSTMDCYYHNVAKYFEKDAQKGFWGHLGDPIVYRRKCGQFTDIDDLFQRGGVKHLRLRLLPASGPQHYSHRNDSKDHHGGHQNLRFDRQPFQGVPLCPNFVPLDLLTLRRCGLRLLLLFYIHVLSLLWICILLVVIPLNSVYHI